MCYRHVIIEPPGKTAAIFSLGYGTCLSSCRVTEQLFRPHAEKVRAYSAVHTSLDDNLTETPPSP